MSDSSSSSSSSKPSFRVSKKSVAAKKPSLSRKKVRSLSSSSSASAKTAKSTKSVAKSVSKKNVEVKKAPVNFSRIAPRLGIRTNSPNTTRKLMRRLTEAQAKAYARKLDKEVEEAVYKKLTKKAKRSLNAKDKKLIAAVATNASRSGSLNIDRLIGHLRTAPTFLENVAKAGTKFQKGFEKRQEALGKANAMKAYEARQAFVKAQEEEFNDRLKAAKTAIAVQVERVPKGTKKPSSKEIAELCKLRAHGFDITVSDHLVLREHLANEQSMRITRRLAKQAETMSACAMCDIEHYLMNM
jgi:preprotein translocase subunit Sss1